MQPVTQRSMFSNHGQQRGSAHTQNWFTLNVTDDQPLSLPTAPSRQQATYRLIAVITSVGISAVAFTFTFLRFYWHIQGGGKPWVDMGVTLGVIAGGMVSSVGSCEDKNCSLHTVLGVVLRSCAVVFLTLARPCQPTYCNLLARCTFSTSELQTNHDHLQPITLAAVLDGDICPNCTQDYLASQGWLDPAQGVWQHTELQPASLRVQQSRNPQRAHKHKQCVTVRVVVPEHLPPTWVSGHTTSSTHALLDKCTLPIPICSVMPRRATTPPVLGCLRPTTCTLS